MLLIEQPEQRIWNAINKVKKRNILLILEIFLNIVAIIKKKYYPVNLYLTRRLDIVNITLMTLNFLSLIYKIVLILREFAFKTGILKKKKLDCFVVSVGNITLGGTGKTPCVEMLAKLISSYGKSVSIISRGYKRKSKGLRIVSDGRKIFTTKEDSGDESFYLAKTLLGNIPIIVCKDRYKAGLLAIKEFLSKVIILDDGFQRRYNLRRDLDIVLIDATNPFGNHKLFPSGILRESLGSLKDADIFILTKSDSAEDKEKLQGQLKQIKNNCSILESVYKPVSLIWNDEIKELSFIKNKRIFLLSGIGNPFYFEGMVVKLGANIIEHLKYPDHYRYSDNDILDIENRFKNSKSDIIITTEKDAIRLPEFKNIDTKIYSLKIEFEILDEYKEKFIQLLKLRGII